MNRRLLLLAPLLLAAGPANAPQPYALPSLTVRQGGTLGADRIYTGGSFVPVTEFDPPDSHWRSDTLIAFEGPGWETDKIGYRLYLDARNVPDIYGKKLPGPILPKIGHGIDDYHEMADWGRDIFQVDDSLGMGGIGVLRDGKATQLGPAHIHADIRQTTSGWAKVHVTNRGFAGDGGAADLDTVYSIGPGSRVTWVDAGVAGHVPAMVAGLRHHSGTRLIRSPEDGRGFGYVATWGRQSLAGDDLGIVLFYPLEEARFGGDDGMSLYVRFCDPRSIHYAFAAAWVQEPGAPKTEAAFRKWLDETALDLGMTTRVIPQGQHYCG